MFALLRTSAQCRWDAHVCPTVENLSHSKCLGGNKENSGIHATVLTNVLIRMHVAARDDDDDDDDNDGGDDDDGCSYFFGHNDT